MTATQPTEPTPAPTLLDIGEQHRRDLITTAVDSVRWARDWSATQAADADPGIYTPERRHSYTDPAVCLARGRDAASASTPTHCPTPTSPNPCRSSSRPTTANNQP